MDILSYNKKFEQNFVEILLIFIIIIIMLHHTEHNFASQICICRLSFDVSEIYCSTPWRLAAEQRVAKAKFICFFIRRHIMENMDCTERVP